MDIVFDGIKVGMVLTLLIGPVFFTILQASIERGFLVGVVIAIGVSISDLFYIVICYFGFSSFMAESSVRIYMGYGGGSILIAFGLYYLLIKSKQKEQVKFDPVGERKKFRYLIKGFLINGMNPMVPIFWIGTVSLATIDFGYSSTFEFVLFFGSVLATVLFTDITKAFLSGQLRKIVSYRSLMILHILLGIGLIIFGGRLILLTRMMTLT